MGSPSNLIEYAQDKNSHFYLCQCKTSIGLYEDGVITDTIHLVIVLENVINVKFSDSHLRITECEIQNIHCAKCGVRLGYKVATPRKIPHPNDDPLVVFWLDWTKVLEWNGNEILGAHSEMSPRMKRFGMDKL
ncbi:hypothetical protein ACJIZ3_007825 [Penstemon smallii]|uniref:Protein yippee-like n=1 Tax=Penstemon smallii TaxID=265156 RepID=A0ABD3T818_9LAMI